MWFVGVRPEIPLIYDRFVRHYNSSNNKVRGLTELKMSRDAILKYMEDLEEKIDDSVDFIEYTFFLRGEPPSAKYEGKFSESQLKRIKDHKREILELIKWDAEHRDLSLNEPESREEYEPLFKELYTMTGNPSEYTRTFSVVERIIELHRKMSIAQSHIYVLKLLKGKIIEGFYPPGLELYEHLNEQEKDEIGGNKNEYTPHHNTRKGLVEDLKKIINEIKDNQAYFHDDGTIKHTTVAKYAVDQKWFSDKHGYGYEGLYKHIKMIHKYMKST